MTKTTVFTAKKIITMNPSRPLATHVAMREGRILAAGTADEMAGWGPFELNDDFADKVLRPVGWDAGKHVGAVTEQRKAHPITLGWSKK